MNATTEYHRAQATALIAYLYNVAIAARLNHSIAVIRADYERAMVAAMARYSQGTHAP